MGSEALAAALTDFFLCQTKREASAPQMLTNCLAARRGTLFRKLERVGLSAPGIFTEDMSVASPDPDVRSSAMFTSFDAAELALADAQ